MSPDNQTVSVSLLALTSSISAFASFLPPLTEVRKATLSDRAVVNDLRLAEIASASLALGIGLTGSALTKSPLPASFAVVSAGAIVFLYESVLMTRPKENR